MRLEVTPQWDEESFLIAVSGRGPGVEPKELETLFEPFVQGHRSVNVQGFALGLYIAPRAS